MASIGSPRVFWLSRAAPRERLPAAAPSQPSPRPQLSRAFPRLQHQHHDSPLHHSPCSFPVASQHLVAGGCRFVRGRQLLPQTHHQLQPIATQQQRTIATFRKAMRKLQWPLMRAEMSAFFQQQLKGPARTLEQLSQYRMQQQQQQPAAFWRSSAVDIECRPWERFVSSEQIQSEGFIPCVIGGKGVYRKCVVSAAALHELAFDEAEGHLSLRNPSTAHLPHRHSIIVIDQRNPSSQEEAEGPQQMPWFLCHSGPPPPLLGSVRASLHAFCMQFSRHDSFVCIWASSSRSAS